MIPAQDILKMAAATLTLNKLRSCLTILGIAIGNAAVILTYGIGQGSQDYILSRLEEFGPNLIGVFEDRDAFTWSESRLVLSDAEAIQQTISAVQAVAPVIWVESMMVRHEQRTLTTLKGTTPDYLFVRSFTLQQGRFFEQSEVDDWQRVIVLGPELAKKLFDTENPIGQGVQIERSRFEVIGVMAPKGSLGDENEDDDAYVPITTLASQNASFFSPYGLRISYVQVSAKDSNSIRTAAFQIQNLLTQRHGKQDFIMVSSIAYRQLVRQITGTLTLVLALLAGVSLFVGGVGIMNIMLFSVHERAAEIGIRRALGATKSDILIQFLIEAVFVASIGGLVGSLTGVAVAGGINTFATFQLSISAPAILLSVSISGGIGICFGVLPAYQAANLDPIAALNRT
ncbi:ABC transporter permease [Oscillatoria sp. CS-180]|uniref:ABC transporter permease n=1 Tax=Oscillatoria sp. CS-180 TaxID=3021720 RepID=UPI00232B8011|nr:ABC transporter permease [Oscillatoria sp. CS-180]MDB9527404.1 ABC transporter permease [Oscillatoria sp. CS-180]